MGAVQGSMNYVLDKSRETASVMGAEKWINYGPEKSKEFVAVLQPFGKICIAKVPDEIFPPLQHFGKLCIAKLDEVFPLLQRFGKLCIAKVLDDVFPPLQQFGKICIAKVGEVFPPEITAEQMKYWVKVGTPCIIGVVVILILLRFFRGGGGGSMARMMIAPGTGRAFRIPRASFEASPRSYFRGLRGK
ncbi:uncharacterized protein LOC131301025 isoform X1 [Rhododendron vialii]|uniref:uncharacterized protein LOC131301025 isoform X1 n=1 Tax=Rhododendron vialii TaxID=182163 RepID=UPI00265EB37E|nr:uncharacterized protein LOC131301025 isoform X1 [Rhododendron vialii]